jgi:hypothetical protein
VVTHIVPPVLAVSCAAIADWANAEGALPKIPDDHSAIAAASIIRPIIELPWTIPTSEGWDYLLQRSIPDQSGKPGFLKIFRDAAVYGATDQSPGSEAMTTEVKGGLAEAL